MLYIQSKNDDCNWNVASIILMPHEINKHSRLIEKKKEIGTTLV